MFLRIASAHRSSSELFPNLLDLVRAGVLALLVLTGSISALGATGDPYIAAQLLSGTHYMCNQDPTAVGYTPESACQVIVDRQNASADFHTVSTAWDCSYTVQGRVHSDRTRTITGTGLAWRWGAQHIEVIGTDVTVTEYFSPCYPGGTSSGGFSLWFDTLTADEYSCAFDSPHSAVSGSLCHCLPGFSSNAIGSHCVPNSDTVATSPPPSSCNQAANPIVPLTGAKIERRELSSGIGGLPVVLTYDSSRRPALAPGLTAASLDATDPAGFAVLWLSSLHKRLVLGKPGRSGASSILALRGDGAINSFAYSNNAITPAPTVLDSLSVVAAGFRYTDFARQTSETYDVFGTLTKISAREGTAVDFVYSDASTLFSVAPFPGLLIRAQDSFGRAITFAYTASAGSAHVSQMTDASGGIYSFAYDASGNLTSITWPDSKQVQFVYESAIVPWALTGVIDEAASRYSTFGYDAVGRAVSSEHAGGVDLYTVAYGVPPVVDWTRAYDANQDMVVRRFFWNAPTGTVLTTPRGSKIDWTATVVDGYPNVSTRSQPAGAGCAASTSSMAFDAGGGLSSRTDFSGNRTCFANDPLRHVETARVEGLANTVVCSGVTGSGATLPAGSRKTSTQWHPDWRLESKRAEPLKLTTWVYNGQPDPFNGGAIASCAPAGAVLPDGKPIVVLCKQVEQATTDANGALGFSAALQVGVANRQQSWTYNQYGQVLTATDPLSHTTSYAYYASTGADYTMGDLQQVTNALGQVTSYPKYNKHGQVLRMVEPNGVITDNTYDLRQRLTSTTVGGQQTTYTYDPVGQLIELKLPDTTKITYTWDDAHRLTKVTDQAGNSVTYTLDNAGNRTADQIKDPSGTLTRTVTRVFDALNRVQQATGGMQ